MTLQEVDAFFGRYRDAFNCFDGNAVADLWHSPSAISHPEVDREGATVTSWATDEPMRANHRALCSIYQKRPAHHWSFVVSDHVDCGRDQSFANVQWRAMNAAGVQCDGFCTGYVLVRAPDLGIKVAHCLQYEEQSEKT